MSTNSLNTASLELCKELYKLSGWGMLDTDKCWAFHGSSYRLKNWPTGKLGMGKLPAYNLGYLLRKLPPSFTYRTPSDHNVNVNIYMELIAEGNAKFIIASVGLTTVWWQSYGTPEDVACKLAIKLFEQGILTKSEAKS
jgi:hypothetical protein